MIDQDLQHLRALSICHYVMAGLSALFSSFFLIYLVLGIMFVASPSTMSGGSGPPPPAFMGWLFIFIAVGAILIGWSFAILLLLSGRFLAQLYPPLFCFIMVSLCS